MIKKDPIKEDEDNLDSCDKCEILNKNIYALENSVPSQFLLEIFDIRGSKNPEEIPNDFEVK